MIAVDEINVSMARGPEEHGVARSASRVGMGGRIAGPEVGLVLNDSTGEQLAPFASNQQLAQQVAGDDNRIAIVEIA